MGKLVDLTGQRFGRLTVIERAENKGHDTAWACRCDCGKKTVVIAKDLKSGHTKSCGCFANELTAERSKTHGGRYSRIYRIWQSVINRCYNQRFKQFSDYGGRGITVCDEWKHYFPAFRDWALANGYADNLTIDRRDNGKGYSPDNCRWITRAEQNRNRRPSSEWKKPKTE